MKYTYLHLFNLSLSILNSDQEIQCRPFHGFQRHLAWLANTVKLAINVS